MPLSKHYDGHGKQVMIDMKQRYGSEKGKEVFYATTNKRKKKTAEAQARAVESS